MKFLLSILISSLWILLNTSFHKSEKGERKSPTNERRQTPNAKRIPIPQNYFINPIDIPIALAGNFGEPRRLHFHTGIDIRTNEEEGHAVFAAADGYISRINVSSVGYGNALYIRHANGLVTVYGHLQKFSEKIEKRLRKEQYTKESFSVDFNLQTDELPVQQGDTIALSGNTGGSGGPHLHFEIRDTSENVYNPLAFGFNFVDSIKPTVSTLKFYPLDTLKFKCDGYRTKLKNAKSFFTTETEIVKLNAKQVGFSLNTFDMANKSNAHIGIYSLTAFENEKVIYRYTNDKISFPEKRCVLSQIDYPVFLNEAHRAYHKCFVEPGNVLNAYSDLVHSGRVDLSDGKIHNIRIEAKDFAGNNSSVKFKLKFDSALVVFKAKELKFVKRFDYDKDNEYATADIKLKIPEGCLFDTVYFNYTAALATDEKIVSKIHRCGSSNTQVFDWFNISVKAEKLSPEFRDKALLVYKDDKGATASRGGKFENGFIVSRSREFGQYYVTLDTTLPVIKPVNISAGKNMRALQKILIKISDNLSGIADFDTYIDDTWVLTGYDAKSSLLTHKLDQTLPAGEHKFKVVVTDERHNKAEWEVKFAM